MFANTHDLSIYSPAMKRLQTINCCTPLAGSSLSDAEAVELERLFRVLGDRHRVRILNILLRAAGQAVCVCEFTDQLGLAQPTVSYHLKQLTAAGLLDREKRGTFAYFRVRDDAMRRLQSLVEPATFAKTGLSVDAKLARALLAEAVGTFALVFAGCGAIMVDATTHSLGHVGVAISFGLVIMIMIYAVGHISGAHFNGSVTLAFAFSRHFPWRRVPAYWAAQLAGAIAAALVLRGSLGDVAHVGATLPSGSDGQAFLWEAVMTFLLMFVIMAVATDTRAIGEGAAIAIGGTDRPRCAVWRPDHGRLDEPHPIARPGHRVG